MYNCNMCNESFGEENDLINHNRIAHSSLKRAQYEDENKLTKREKVKCSKCKEQFTSSSQLRQHQSYCLKCKQCGKQFYHNKEFQEHRRQHFIKNDANTEQQEEENTDYIEKTAFSKNLVERTWHIKGYYDLIKTLQSHKSKILNLIQTTIRENASPIKFRIAVKLITFRLTKDNEKEYINFGLQSGTHYLMTSDEAEEKFSACSQLLWDSFDKWNEAGSGINLEKVASITLKIAKTRIIQGSSYIPTPKLFPRSIVNVRNIDNRCFEYAILSALHYDEVEGRRQNPNAYKQWLGKELKLEDFPVPMPVFEISKFEKLHPFSVNVYYFDIKSTEKNVTPIYISKKRTMTKPINLLVLDNGSDYHYTYITKFSNLFQRKCKEVKFCPYCLQQFWSVQKHDNHVLICKDYKAVQTKIPTGDKKWIEFNKIEAMEEHPVVIYADFETFNIPIEIENLQKHKLKKKTWQDICGYSFVVASPYFKNRSFTYRGENATKHFLKSILKEQKKIEEWFMRHRKSIDDLSQEELSKFDNADKCYICNEHFVDDTSNVQHMNYLRNSLEDAGFKPDRIPSKSSIQGKIRKIRRIEEKLANGGKIDTFYSKMYYERQKELLSKLEDIQEYLIHNNIYTINIDEMNEQDLEVVQNLRKGCKVKDHNHWNGNYRGAAHASCNLKMRKFRKIPCFFHNFAGYDSHLLIRGMDSELIKSQPKVIAKSMERIISLTLDKIEFKDSFQFLAESLDRLVSNLKSKSGNITDVFPNTWNYFNQKWRNLDKDAFEMITEKLIYPYSYFKSFSNFEEENLPSISNFYNELSRKEISLSDYEKVKRLWKTFGMKNLGDLHDLYVECDVHLLADCFEYFRKFSLKNYRLDPAHFISAPALSWHSALLHTNVKLEIPQDPDMHLFIDR